MAKKETDVETHGKGDTGTDTGADTATKTTEAGKKPAAKSAKAGPTKHEQECIALALKYFKNYPGEKVLHVASDMQVFLDRNKGLATIHQGTLPKGSLVSIGPDGKIIG